MSSQQEDPGRRNPPLVMVARFIGVVAVIVVALIAILVVLDVLPASILEDAAVKIVLVTVIAAAAIGLVSLLVGGGRR